MSDYVPMTREAYDRKKAQVKIMEQDEVPKIAEKIAAARDEGDLKENAEYHAQREAMGLLQAKINQLKTQLVRAQIIDPTQVPRDEVALGATVLVKDLDIDDEEENDDKYFVDRLKEVSGFPAGSFIIESYAPAPSFFGVYIGFSPHTT